MIAAQARGRTSYLEHTADLGFEVRADSLAGLFETAALALSDVLVDADRVQARGSRVLELEAEDRERLLVRLLREELYLYDSERWLVGEARARIDLAGRSLQAELLGESFDPQRHAIKTEVKAVTYHALAVRDTAEGYTATVVLDL